MRKRIQREDKEMTDYTTTAAGLVRKARRRGVTLIEAVLFISIALGLIVGGLVFFQQASLAQRTADAVRNISALASETRALYQSSIYFDGATESVLINVGRLRRARGHRCHQLLHRHDRPAHRTLRASGPGR